MAYPTDRVILHDRVGNLLPELAPDQVLSRLRTEELNGEHEMVIVTSRRMEEGWRALTVDGSGRWREWVLTEPDEAHEAGETALGTYRFVWSLQYDLTTSYAHTEAEAGMGESCTSLYALNQALEGVNGWEAGPCDAPAIEAGKGCVMIYESAWSRLSKVVEATGGEVDAEITVSNLYGVTSRRVLLSAHVGSTRATRRFDWGRDVSNIHRIPDPGPYYCRVVPLGRGEQEYAEDDETTFEWPLDITDETGDPDLYYIQDDEAAEAFRVPDGQGGWLYPTKAVKYSEDDPELLLNAAMDDLHNHTRPGVTYEADVLQLAEAGMDVSGVSLGDDVHIVDRGFNPDVPLRLQGRIVRIEVDELSPETTTVLTIGSVRHGFTSVANTLAQLQQQQSDISYRVAGLDTATYLRGLIDRINAEIAATGGYTYLVPGQGMITYDAAVSDPLVASEASKVVQIKGGYIRIADAKNAGFAGIDDWNWKTVFESGHILAALVTAAQLTAGYIGNATNGNYWDLDTGEFRMATNAVMVGSDTLDDYVDGIVGDATQDMVTTDMFTQQSVFNKLTNNGALQGLYMSNNELYINATYVNTGYLGDVNNGNYWNLDTGEFCMQSNLTKVGNQTLASYVSDVSDDMLTQQNVFNALTSNGTIQGLYMSNGQLYVNGTYIKGGTISAGGTNNVNGIIEVYDASNSLTAKFDKDGAYIKGDVQMEKDSTSTLIGTFSDTVTTYAGTISGTQTGLKITSGTSAYYSIYLVPYASGTITGGLIACRHNLTLAAYTRESYGPYLGMTNGSTVLAAKGSNAARVYLESSMGYGSQGGSIVFRWERSGGLTVQNELYVTGNKNRLVETSNYGKRPLSAYETPEPMFGDIGSGTIGDDGLCYVSIDPIFSETARTDLRYYVFLQGYGGQSVSVMEKNATFFVVSGQPGAEFDWEIKAKQRGYENVRMDDYDLVRSVTTDPIDVLSETIDSFDNDLDSYVQDIKDCLEEVI